MFDSENNISANLLLDLINKFKTIYTGTTGQSAAPGSNITVIIDNKNIIAKACTSIKPGIVSVLKTKDDKYLAFCEKLTKQTKQNIPQFRRNRQINKRYVGETESSSNKTPILFTNKEEIKAPILVSENKIEYGNVGVLFAKFKTYEEYPSELCKCEKWQPLKDKCVKVCDENGEFDTEQECNTFRANRNAGQSDRYFATSDYNGFFNGGKAASFWTEYNQPKINGYTFTTLNGIPIKECLYIPFTNVYDEQGNPTNNKKYALTKSYYKNCGLEEYPDIERWVDINGDLHKDSEVIMYFAGVFQQYNYGMELVLINGYKTYDNTPIGNNGIGQLSNQYPAPLGGNVFTHEDISIQVGQGEAYAVKCDYQDEAVMLPPYTQLGYCRYFRTYGKLNNYLKETIYFNPPALPDKVQPIEADNNEKYVSIEFYLGGDRKEPIKLGEYFLEKKLTRFYRFTNNYSFEIFDYPYDRQSEYEKEGNLLYPSWFNVNNNNTYFFNGNEHQQLITSIYEYLRSSNGLLNSLARFNIAAYIVRLNENETEICIKHGRFNQSYYENSIRKTDTLWCNIDIIKVNKASIEKTTYKYPDTPIVSSENWASPWCTNWSYAKEGVITTNSQTDSYQVNYPTTNGDIDNTSIRAFNNYKKFKKPELAQYLSSNLALLKTYFNRQTFEITSIPVDKNQLSGGYGCNFRVIEDNLYCYDIIPYQPVKVKAIRNNIEKDYIPILMTAIKNKDVEVYLRYGETQRTTPTEYFDYYNYGGKKEQISLLHKYGTFNFKEYKTIKTKIFKIPEDSLLLEISPYVNTSKIQNSTLILPDILFSSNLVNVSYDRSGENEIVEFKNIIKWTNSFIPQLDSVGTLVHTYQWGNESYIRPEYRNLTDKTYYYYYVYQSNLTLPNNEEPFLFTECNNNTIEYPYIYRSKLNNTPIIEGFCE